MDSDEYRTSTRDEDIGSTEIDTSLTNTLYLFSIELYPCLEFLDDLIVESSLSIVCICMGWAQLFHAGIIEKIRKKKVENEIVKYILYGTIYKIYTKIMYLLRISLILTSFLILAPISSYAGEKEG